MNTLGQAIWLHWVVLGLLLIAFCTLVYVAWWALFADRPRGRRRCPRCWYDMSYSPGMTCPECGRTARREAEFGRRRRRLGIAAMAILGCTAIGGYVDYHAGLKDWLNYVPTTMLIWSIPIAGDHSRSVFIELDTREAKGRLSDDQWFDVLRRSVVGDPGARPPSDAWIQKYGNFHIGWTRSRFRSLEGEMKADVERLLLSMPVPIELHTRTVWPADVQPTIRVRVRDRWRAGVQARCRTTVRLKGASAVVHVRERQPIQTTSFLLRVPQLPPGEHEIGVDVDVEMRMSPQGEWIAAPTQSLTCTVQIAGADDGVLEPVVSEELDDLMREVFSRRLVQWTGGGSLPVRVGLNAQHTFVERFDDTAVAVRVEVRRNGELGRILDIWWHAGTNAPSGQYAWHVPMWNDEVLGAPLSEHDQWTLRVRGLRQLALRVEGPSRYWAGEITVPTAVRSQRGAAPSRGWLQEGLHEERFVPLDVGSPPLVTAH